METAQLLVTIILGVAEIAAVFYIYHLNTKANKKIDVTKSKVQNDFINNPNDLLSEKEKSFPEKNGEGQSPT